MDKKKAESGRQIDVVEAAPVARPWEDDPGLLSQRATGYPEEVRDEFVQRVFGGETITAVASEMGISRSTGTAWMADFRQERAEQEEINNMKFADKFGTVMEEFVKSAIKVDKLDKASTRDLMIAAGIAADKRKDLLGPQKSGSVSRLRIAWKDGSGAVELETGQ